MKLYAGKPDSGNGIKIYVDNPDTGEWQELGDLQSIDVTVPEEVFPEGSVLSWCQSVSVPVNIDAYRLLLLLAVWYAWEYQS